MTEVEVKEKVMSEYVQYIQSGRCSVPGYCCICKKDNRPIMYHDMLTGEGICEDCWMEKRRRQLLKIPIPDLSKVQEEKDKRAEEVRKYFATRKKEEV